MRFVELPRPGFGDSNTTPQWRTLSAWAGDRDFIFPNANGGFLDYENFEARVLAPIRIKLGLGRLNFQILRRSYAAHLPRACADLELVREERLRYLENENTDTMFLLRRKS
jgi:integrase